MATAPEPAVGGRAAVTAAVAALYHPPGGDAAARAAAATWLEAWQAGPAAWADADGLLHDAGAPMEARYLAAQTLRTKVQRDFEELPPAAVPSLRDSLAALTAAAAAAAEPPVRTQLVLALAALAAHAPAASWPGGGPVPWAARVLGDGPRAALLEFLTVLPEEAAAPPSSVAPARRRELAAEAAAASPAALTLLERCLPDAGVRSHVLQAFASWLRLGAGGPVAAGALATSPLVAAALAALGDADAFDAGVDAVEQLIARTSAGGAPSPAAAPLVAAVVPAVLALRPRFALASARAAGGDPPAPHGAADYDDDDDAAAGMARLFAEIGEAYVDAVADEGDRAGSADGSAPPASPARDAAAALLDVAAHPDDRVASMAYLFWHRLARALTAGTCAQPLGDEGASPRRGARRDPAARVAAFAPLYERLVLATAGRAKWPPGADEWRRDERAEFRRARCAAADVLDDAAAVLGPSAVLSLVATPLADAAAAARSGAGFDWRAAEGALFCARAVARAPPPAGDPLLLSLLASLPGLPAGPAQLQATAAAMAASCAEWLAACADGGAAGAADTERALLQSLAGSLATPDAAPAAAVALRAIASAATARAGAYAAPLADLFARALADGDARPPGAPHPPGLALSEGDVQAVGDAAMAAVCALGDAAARRAAVDALLAPVEASLAAALAPGASAPPPPLPDRAASLLRRCRDPAAAAAALARLWPSLEAGLAASGGDVATVERWCRVARHGLKAAGRDAAPLLPALADKLPRWFAGTRAPAFLYVASELVKTFGPVPAAGDAVAALVAATFAEAAAALPDAGAVAARPDVADDAFLLAGRALAYAPAAALGRGAAGTAALLDAGVAGLLVQHREACTSILRFVELLFSPDVLHAAGPAGAAAASALAVPRGPRLVARLLAGALGALPPARLRDVGDTLHAVLRTGGGGALEWARAALAALPDAAAPAPARDAVAVAAAAVAAAGPAAADAGALDAALEELSETVRRSGAARRAALAALLPGEGGVAAA